MQFEKHKLILTTRRQKTEGREITTWPTLMKRCAIEAKKTLSQLVNYIDKERWLLLKQEHRVSPSNKQCP